MLLAKITRGNQITIPKEIVKRAHLTRATPYVEVQYAKGVIQLKPVTVEERISPEQFDKFQDWAIKEQKSDKHYASLDEGISALHVRAKKK